jgi:adenylate kinase
MFRQAAEADTPLGRRLRSYMDRGELVPDSLTNELVEARIGEPDAAGGFVLDGYPRSVDQAEMLDRSLAARGAGLDAAVKFMITGPEIVRRLSARRVCPVDGSVYNLVTQPPKVPGRCDVDGTPLVQREDDREETVLRRLEVYGTSTKPLYDRYAERGILVPVDAIGSADEVFERLLKALGIDQEQEAGQTGTGKAGR